MIGKNLITVLIVVVVLAIAFFSYQHFTKSKDLQEHHQDTFSRLTEAANKSPRAGMAQMAKAINQYYAENNSYPLNLSELYPKYIGDQSFINNVSWSYRSLGGNFQLSKSVVSGNRTLVASVDKSLSVRMGTTTVAMAEKTETAASKVEKPIQIASIETKTAAVDLAADKPSQLLSPQGLPPTAEIPVAESEKTKEPDGTDRRKKETGTDVVIDKSETPSAMVSELSNSYLVWKDENGHLGFGNVQYPRIDGLSIATPYNWFNVRQWSESESSAAQEIMTTADDTDTEVLASKYSDQYLVWKNKQGDIGIGNVQYPKIGLLSIATTDNWFNVKRRSGNESSTSEEMLTTAGGIDMEALAAKYSDQYLVWKDKNGNIGFGDARYPDNDQVEFVNIDGTWLKVTR